MYDSDKSSLSSSDSSESGDQSLTKEEKQGRKNDKRIKNAIAYRFSERKEEQKFKRLFQTWKDFCLLNYRSNLIMAIKHYENTLCLKGFDGLMEYAMISESFKQKVVMFYYHFYMNKFFQTLKKGYRASTLRDSSHNKTKETMEPNLFQINRNLDSLLKKNESQKNAQNSFVQSSIKKQVKEKQIQQVKRIQKQKQFELNKVAQSAFLSLGDFFQQQRLRKLKLAFKSIQQFLPNLKKVRKVSPPKNYEAGSFQDEAGNGKMQIVPESQSNRFRRSNETHLIYDNRQFNSMINSRRSGFTQSNYSGLKQNRSRRKLAPIVQKVQLVPLPKKASNQVSSKQKNIPSKSPVKPINDFQNRKSESRSRSKEKDKIKKQVQQPQKKPEPKPTKNLEQHRQRDQIENMKRVQDKKDRIISILARGKLLQLCLINDMKPQQQNFLRSYRQLSMETLSQIKSK